jgi:hypothetical protein
MIPFLDLKATYGELKDELNDAAERVLSSGWYILGESERLRPNGRYATPKRIGVAMAQGPPPDLRAMDIGDGDEIIAVEYVHRHVAGSSYASALRFPLNPIQHIQFVPIDQTAITPRTRVMVHLYGQPADMDASTRSRRGATSK